MYLDATNKRAVCNITVKLQYNSSLLIVAVSILIHKINLYYTVMLKKVWTHPIEKYKY